MINDSDLEYFMNHSDGALSYSEPFSVPLLPCTKMPQFRKSAISLPKTITVMILLTIVQVYFQVAFFCTLNAFFTLKLPSLVKHRESVVQQNIVKVSRLHIIIRYDRFKVTIAYTRLSVYIHVYLCRISLHI